MESKHLDSIIANTPTGDGQKEFKKVENISAKPMKHPETYNNWSCCCNSLYISKEEIEKISRKYKDDRMHRNFV